MNQAIRKWIEENHQPWRHVPGESFLRGTIGAEGAFPLHPDAARYYESRGVAVEGRTYEELQEADLLDALEKISTWLPPEQRKRLDETVAFGSASTRNPNAYAMQSLDGYAILFDYGFDTLLISSDELYWASLLSPASVPKDEFSLGLNAAIVSQFFHTADYWTPIPDEAFEHRELVNSSVWLMSVFLLAHELGHIMRDHLVEAPTRSAILSRGSGVDPIQVAILQPAQRGEFEADEFAVDLMLQGGRADPGLFQSGADRDQGWNSAYLTLGWLFSIMAAIEILAKRLDEPINDTHPPAVQRWSRVEALVRERAPISRQTIELERATHEATVDAAGRGKLPVIRRELAGADLVAVPYSRRLASFVEPPGATAESRWTPPPGNILGAWINAQTPAEAKGVLSRHPELLHPNVDLLHYYVVDKYQQDDIRTHVLRKRLPLLQRSRAIGIDAAFEELDRGVLPMPKPPAPEFYVPLELIKQYGVALESGDQDRLKELAESSPELSIFVKMHDTAAQLMKTKTPAETQESLEEHPELLHPSGDKALAQLAEAEPTDKARAKVETFRSILARAGEVGIARAIVEARVKRGVDEQGRPVGSLRASP
jgi:hypothetical protein